MQKKTIIFLFTSLFFSLTVSSQTWIWTEQFSGDFNIIGKSVATSEDQMVYVAGSFQDEVNFFDTTISAQQDYDIFLASFTFDGEMLWIKHIQGTGPEVTTKLKYADGYLYLCGYYAENADFGTETIISAGGMDGFVAKYNSNGQLEWVQSGGGLSEDFCYDVSVNADGETFITGSTNSIGAGFGDITIGFNGLTDAFVAQYAPDGTCNWAYNVGGPSYDYGRSIAAANNNTVYIGGRFAETIQLADTSLTAEQAADIYIANISNDGSLQWARQAGGNLNEDVNSILTDQDNNIWLTGWFMGTISFSGSYWNSAGEYDIYLARYDPEGNNTGSLIYGSSGSDEGRDLALPGNNTIVLAGSFSGQVSFGIHTLTSEGYEDGFIAWFNQDFDITQVEQVGGSSILQMNGVATIGLDHVLITGNFYDDINFGGTTYNSMGGYDAFLARYGFYTGVPFNSNDRSHDVLVYPNPTCDYSIIALQDDDSRAERIDIFDINGKWINSLTPGNANLTTWYCCDFNENRVNPGVYLIQLITNSTVKTVRIQVK